ncbi:MAG: hypothetical protein AB7N54_19490 [Alphaproteobacteria bacterium]
MSVDYSNAVKDARLAVVRDVIDADTDPGKIEIGTAGMAAVLATIPLEKPCGTVAGQTLTFDAPVEGTASAAGTAAEARIKDGAGNVVVSGLTVGLADADVVLGSITLSAGLTVRIESGSIAHA